MVFPHSLKMLSWLNLGSNPLFFVCDPRSSQVPKDSVVGPLVVLTSTWLVGGTWLSRLAIIVEYST